MLFCELWHWELELMQGWKVGFSSSELRVLTPLCWRWSRDASSLGSAESHRSCSFGLAAKHHVLREEAESVLWSVMNPSRGFKSQTGFGSQETFVSVKLANLAWDQDVEMSIASGRKSMYQREIASQCYWATSHSIFSGSFVFFIGRKFGKMSRW